MRIIRIIMSKMINIPLFIIISIVEAIIFLFFNGVGENFFGYYLENILLL